MSDHDVIPHTSTLASRNPTSTVQSSRTRVKETSVQRASRKPGRQAKQATEAFFAADIRILVAQRDALVATLADKHSKTPDYVYKVINTASAYKKERRPNLHNARSHFKSVTINNDQDPGKRANLQELQRMARDDSNMQDLTEKQNEDLLQSLLEHRETKKKGIRPSNRSAAIDTRTTLDRIQSEVQNLHSRT